MVGQKLSLKILILLLIIVISIGLLYFSASIDQKLKQRKEIDKVDISEFPKVINSIKKMVLVSGGTFTFYMDETPVTYEDFQKYIEEGGTKSRYWEYETYNQPENPVTGVDWYQAVDYCNWRSEIEGLSPTYKLTNQSDSFGYPLWELDISADGYRLPTEPEFEYAGSGGLVDKSFPWGNEFDPSFANYDNERGEMKGKWWRLSKIKDTPSNNYGLYGMSGNIWQWTNDWYILNHTKILKGGSWGSISPDDLKIKAKSYAAPSHYNYDIGFRCIRPVKNKKSISPTPHLNLKAPHKFYQYKTTYPKNPIQIDVYSEEFINLLTQFIAEHYPNSIYFQTKIDKQEIIAPKQMAKEIVETAKEYNIHPLFLIGVMAAESGFRTVSFPRWYNNPMAYHWQNALMKNGLPTYEANPSRNQKYKDLKSAFREFSKGIRKDIYLKAAQKDLDTFHLLYVGYRTNEWMYTISKVYRDALGIKLEPHEPAENVGKLIYTDWNSLF